MAAEILTDFPERLKRLTSVELFKSTSRAADSARRVQVRLCWLSQSRGGQAIFHFEGSESIDDAKGLVGLEVQIPLAERIPLPQGSYYVSDLVGCEVVEQSGRVLGRVRDVEFTGEGVAGTPNLLVDSAACEILIPLAQDICTDVDLAARRVTVTLPEGLLDLNANS